MRSLKDFLPESFLTELSDGPSDSSSPVSGATADGHPNPAQTNYGKRELNVGDPVKVVGDVELKGSKGKVDDIFDDGDSIIVNLHGQGRKRFRRPDVEFDEYCGKDDNEDAYLHSLNNFKKLAGY